MEPLRCLIRRIMVILVVLAVAVLVRTKLVPIIDASHFWGSVDVVHAENDDDGDDDDDADDNGDARCLQAIADADDGDDDDDNDDDTTIAEASLRTPCVGSSGAGLLADFNGDGFTDLAIGVPFEDVDGVEDVGAVHILFGSPKGLTRAGNVLLTPGTEAGDRAGAALAAGDFNGDTIADLVVGLPRANTSGQDDAGAVKIFYGPAFTDIQEWHQDKPSILGTAQALDRFGAALAVGDFDGDGIADLAIGVPGEALDPGAFFTGAVSVLYGEEDVGLTAFGDQLWHGGNIFAAPRGRRGDVFGAALAVGDFNGDTIADLAIGIPGRDVRPVFSVRIAADAGAISVLYGREREGLTDSQYFEGQAGPIEGVPEAGDRFGAALAAGDFNGDTIADLAIGVPGEDIDGKIDAGAVNVLYGSVDGLFFSGNRLWHQDSPGIRGTANALDQFGLALAAADFDGDGQGDLAVGVPFEDLPGVPDAGAVNVLYGSDTGLTNVGDQLWHQDKPFILGTAQAFDRFGSTLAWGRFDDGPTGDLAIGVPGEDIGAAIDAGAVNVLYGSDTGLTNVRDQLWHQDSPIRRGIRDVAQAGDQFGAALY